MSALIPGLSQQKSGKRRWLLYAGTEIIALTYYAQRRSRAHSLRDQYRDVAWTEARSYEGQRQDPEFPYYEAMGKWVKSGVWDTNQEPGIQPEGDPSTFNGSVWLLAKDIFLAGEEGTPGSASYARALDFYQTKAHGPAFLWDWTGKSDQMNRFNDLIVDSDGRFAQATNAVGLLIANHLLSALDGMVSARLRSTESLPGHFGLHVSYYVP